VYTRPEFDVATKQYTFKSFTNLELQKLLNSVSTEYLPSEFSEEVLDQFYGKMVHDKDCDYNPYDHIEYYNIHHDDEEVKELLE